MKTRTFFPLFPILLIVGLVLNSTGCKKNPVDPQDDHAEAEGLVLRMNGVDIVVVKEGVVTGSLTVQSGTETDHIHVYFLDPADARFQPTDPDFDLGWAIGDTSIAGIHRDAGEKWEIHVEGKSTGSTTVELQLLHAGHVDFRTPPIPLTVTP